MEMASWINNAKQWDSENSFCLFIYLDAIIILFGLVLLTDEMHMHTCRDTHKNAHVTNNNHIHLQHRDKTTQLPYILA